MKVLMTATDLGPEAKGGIGVHVSALVKRLRGTGADARVVTSASGDPDPFTRRVPYVGPPDLNRFPMSYLAWNLQNNVAMSSATFDDWTPDIVHAHDYRAAFAGAALADRYRVPLVITKHSLHPTIRPKLDGNEAQQLYYDYVEAAERWLFERADRIIAVSEATVDALRRYARVDFLEKTVVIGNGTEFADTDTMAPLLEGDDPVRAAFIGRFIHAKGADLALDAAIAAGDRVQMTMVGSGALDEELRSRALAAGGRIEFLGQLDRSSLRALLEATDVVIVPSRYDALPQVVCEAQATGRFVMAADVGGIPEQVQDGVTGRIIPAGEVDAIVGALHWVDVHRMEARSIARRGHLHATGHYSWDRPACATLEVYEQLANVSV